MLHLNERRRSSGAEMHSSEMHIDQKNIMQTENERMIRVQLRQFHGSPECHTFSMHLIDCHASCKKELILVLLFCSWLTDYITVIYNLNDKAMIIVIYNLIN